jgi:hypothetical protein
MTRYSASWSTRLAYGERVNRVLGAVGLCLALLIPTTLDTPAVSWGSRAVPTATAGYRCVVDVFGETAAGRIRFRRVVNTHVQLTKTTGRTFAWKPLSWGLMSSIQSPGHEKNTYLVAATDGRMRYVRASWGKGRSLSVKVLRTLGSGFPRSLVAVNGRVVYWLSTDGVLHTRAWTGRKFSTAHTHPVTIPDAVSIALTDSSNGVVAYVIDRAGALHAIKGDHDHVLARTGFTSVTGLRAGECMSPNYVYTRSYLGLMTFERSTGRAQIRRHLMPDSFSGGTLTSAVRVPPSDWTWKYLG